MITLKSPREIELMRQANYIVAETHSYLAEQLKDGISTVEIDRMGDEFIRSKGAVPSFKGYRGYPASICVSINNEVVHGIPSKNRVIVSGDIVSLDIGAFYKGFHGDAARTLGVGKISNEAARLIDVTEESFYRGIEKALVGNRLTDISHAVQSYVRQNGFSVVKDYVGHGIGREMHESPQIPNFGPAGRGPVLKVGMTLAIEPMVNVGSYKVQALADGWTVVTKDNSLSAHYENTIAISEDGPQILSKL